MLDDRNTFPDMELLPFITTWTYEDNLMEWAAYVGKDIVGTDKVSKYSAPARETDMSGLPPTYIDVGSLEIFAQEDMEYARKLLLAKVSAEFHLYSGWPHGFEAIVPTAEVSKRAIEGRLRAIKSI